MQRVADDLAASGDVRFVDNPARRRSPRVQLTDRGRRSLDAITEASRLWRAGVAQGLSPESLSSAARH